MNLDNLVKIIVYHLLIKWMIYLYFWDQFLMMSALVYMMHTKYDLQDTHLI